MKYRLGLDLGTHSIGWAVLRLDEHEHPCSIIRLGTRIFPDGRDPKSGESLAANRRLPRSQRRNRSRYLYRRKEFIGALVHCGLMPEDETARRQLQQLNPYQLRKRGLDEKLSLYELGRALFHLNQRRGFLSNRKAERGDKESGKVKDAIEAFQTAMGRSRTVGEVLFQRLQQGQGTRARLRGKGAKASYDFYISREMILDEFDQLWNAQQAFHPDVLSQDAYTTLKHIISWQRPLKPPVVGKCMLEPDYPRAPLALPSSQLFRLYREVNHLRYKALESLNDQSRALSLEQRDQIVNYLNGRKEVKFPVLRKLLFGKENADAFVFTVEEGGMRKSLYGNTTVWKLANKKGFGPDFKNFELAEQEAIVEKLLEEENEATVLEWLQAEYQLDSEQADYVARAYLEEGYLRFSRQAVNKVLPQLMGAWNIEQDQPVTYDQAVRAAGYGDHRALGEIEQKTQLPYYGEILWRYTQDMPNATNESEKEFGRITNPTVHVGLNQLRQLVNAVIRKYGAPHQIHLELSRQLKQNKEQKLEAKKVNQENRERNEKLNAELSRLGQKPNGLNRLKLRLYYELDPLNRKCVYSGKQIKLTQLFSNAYQIDHILPFSKTLDDSYNNKVLVTHRANADKGNRGVPAFAAEMPGYDYHEILERAETLPYHKRKRFAEGAYRRWLGSEAEFDQDGAGFLARQLTDNSYLARVARRYLTAVCPENRIVVSPGHLTALIRGKWGLNQLLSGSSLKNRDDHRHHPMDAVLIGVTDRSLLQRVATRAGKCKERDETSLLKGIDAEMPWEGFREDLQFHLGRMTVSHKPDHNPAAQLHEDTAYGIVSGPDDNGVYTAHHRVPLSRLKKPADLALIKSENTRQRLEEKLSGLQANEFAEAIAVLQEDPKWPNRVRIIRKISGVTVPLSGTAIGSRQRGHQIRPAKLYKGGSNYCYEIFVGEKGKWDGDLITTFVANQQRYRDFIKNRQVFRNYTFERKPLIMRLIRDDLIAIEMKGERQIMRVVQMSEGKIVLAAHYQANTDARNRDKGNLFRYITKSPGTLRSLHARRVFVDALGRVKDPGFRSGG